MPDKLEEKDLTPDAIRLYPLIQKAYLVGHILEIFKVDMKPSRYHEGKKLALYVAYDWQPLNRAIKFFGTEWWPVVEVGPKKRYQLYTGLSEKRRPVFLLRPAAYNKDTDQWLYLDQEKNTWEVVK
jgi:hypothetical protein